MTPASIDRPARRGVALAVLCAAVFVINVDSTIVNIALPALVRQLGSSTRDLQWVVDAYNLTFAALVLAAGSLGDRYGRKGALVAGLALFGMATATGGLVHSTSSLLVVRAVMGVGAAFIFPATLSIISNLYTDRVGRAKAIGAWGAMTGLGVAFGPVTGGFLLEHFWWGSVFVVMAPVAALTLLAGMRFVPTSRDPATPPLDVVGLALSTLGIGALVYTVIEAPDRSWTGAATLSGFALAAVIGIAFVGWERRHPDPMLDLSLFGNLRFTAASGSVTVSFFALGGFVFLITQYFQFLKNYPPLSTGVRILPVAVSIGIGSTLGVRLAVRAGNKIVVAAGLAMVGASFAWVSTASVGTSYREIAGQMVLAGLGLGFTTAPATEAIMGVVSPDKAGVGSAVNDATRELGSTLGVAVVGSVYASLYHHGLDTPTLTATGSARAAAKESIGAAIAAAQRLGGEGTDLLAIARRAFFDGFEVGCLVAAGVLFAGAILAATLLPSRPDVSVLETATGGAGSPSDRDHATSGEAGVRPGARR